MLAAEYFEKQLRKDTSVKVLKKRLAFASSGASMRPKAPDAILTDVRGGVNASK